MLGLNESVFKVNTILIDSQSNVFIAVFNFPDVLFKMRKISNFKIICQTFLT